MESQRLTDADFLAADPSPSGVDAGVSSDNFGGYPDWTPDPPPTAPNDAPPDTDAIAASADQAEIAPDPFATDSSPDNLQSEPLDLAPDADPAEVEATAETAPEPTARERELEARLNAEMEARTALETQQRQQHYAQIQGMVQQAEADLAEHIQTVWNQEVARANGMQPTARAQHLNRVLQLRDEHIAQRRQEITRQAEQQMQGILYHDPTVRDGYYTQVITQFGLPEDARADLAALPPEHLDVYLPQLQRFYQERAKTRQEATQLRRNLEAKRRLESNADAMGGPRGGGRRRNLDPNSPDAYYAAGEWVRR